MNIYKYQGPVYDYNDKEISTNEYAVTHANSIEKAISNIRWKLAKKYSKRVVYIDNDKVIEDVPEKTSYDDKRVLGPDPDYDFEETDMEEKMSFTDVYEELSKLNEEIGRKVLVKDLIYSSVEEFLAKQEVITNITKISNEKMLQAFSDAGYIDGADMIRFPKGTVFTYKASKEYKGKMYDIYYVKGNRYCLVAICTDDMVELFGV